VDRVALHLKTINAGQLKGRYGMKNIYFKKGLSLALFLILSLMISALTFTAAALVERALTG
jgi:hypothetical protein